MNYPLTFENSFTVMPKQLNYMSIIFGGAFMAELDLAAATHVRLLLDKSECNVAVTRNFYVDFFDACMLGDTVFMKSEILEVRNNAIVLEVKAFRKLAPTRGIVGSAERTHCATVKTVFVTKIDSKFHPHGLERYTAEGYESTFPGVSKKIS